MAKTLTNEGATQYDHSLNHYVEFFSKAGSLYKKSARKEFYNNSTTALELFKTMWIAGDRELAMKLLFWLRDCRGGAGNRSGFRECVRWLAETEPAWVKANADLIPLHGRWDDLRVLFGTELEDDAAALWGDAIKEGNGLAAKWAKIKKDKPILRTMRRKGYLRDIAEFRRLIADNRKNIVERAMCQNEWNGITYPHVPSVAMARYTNAFNRHDAERFAQFKTKVEKGEESIKASVLFPHDCTRTALNGDKKIADAQFDALPNFMEGTNRRIMPIVDSSGSMSAVVGGSITRFDVSSSLGLYCSDRIEGPFNRKFIEFCDEGKFQDWTGKTFSECYSGRRGYYSTGIFNGAVGSTRVDKALDLLLSMATTWQVSKDQMPNTLLIISDMQFTGGCSTDMPVVERCLQKWEDAGYSRPDVLYWNVAGYAGSPATVNHPNVGLVSGFSPSILKAVLGGEDFTPIGIMMKAVEKYEVRTPQA